MEIDLFRGNQDHFILITNNSNMQGNKIKIGISEPSLYIYPSIYIYTSNSTKNVSYDTWQTIQTEL